jgi:hypothetical protein
MKYSFDIASVYCPLPFKSLARLKPAPSGRVRCILAGTDGDCWRNSAGISRREIFRMIVFTIRPRPTAQLSHPTPFFNLQLKRMQFTLPKDFDYATLVVSK